MQIDIAIQNEDRLDEVPRVLRSYKVYFNEDGNLACAYLMNQLKEEKHIRDESSLSFFDEERGVYVYGLPVPKSISEIDKDAFIAHKFVKENTVNSSFTLVEDQDKG